MPHKNILIIGDSWGQIPIALYRHSNLRQENDYIKIDENIFNWLDYQLLNRKHCVYNRSWGGSYNFYQLAVAETFLAGAEKNNFNVDLIIWHHTELMKEITFQLTQDDQINDGYCQFLIENGLEKMLDYLAHKTYSYVVKLKEKYPLTEWAILGSGAPLRTSIFKEYFDWVKFLEPNLRSTITGENVIECHTFYSIHSQNGLWDRLIKKGFLTKEEVEIEKSRCEIISNLGKKSKFFYNGQHPSPLAVVELNNRIINQFNL